MKAGRMRYKLVLLGPVRSINSFGEEKVTYNEVRTVNAERVKLTGNRSEEVGEHFPDYRTDWNIRDAHEVCENWRVRQLGGYTYTVTNIVPNLERGYKTLVCARVNE